MEAVLFAPLAEAISGALRIYGTFWEANVPSHSEGTDRISMGVRTWTLKYFGQPPELSPISAQQPEFNLDSYDRRRSRKEAREWYVSAHSDDI